LEEKGYKDEYTYRKALKETIRLLRNKYVLGIEERVIENPKDNFEYMNNQQSSFNNLFKENINNNNNINTNDDSTNYKVCINERKQLGDKRRKLEIINDDDQLNNNLNNQYGYKENLYNYHNDIPYYDNNRNSNNFFNENLNNFSNTINYQNDFNNNYSNDFNQFNMNNNDINYQFPISLNNLFPMTNNQNFNYAFEDNEIPNNFNFPMDINLNQIRYTNNHPNHVNVIENMPNQSNNLFNLPVNNPIQNLPTPNNDDMNRNRSINSKVNPNEIMNSFLSNYNSNNLINNLNKIKQSQKIQISNTQSNKNQNNNKFIESIPILNTINTHDQSNINNNGNNNTTIEDNSIKDKFKYCERYELSSERSEKTNTLKDQIDISNSIKGKEMINTENNDNSQKGNISFEKYNKKNDLKDLEKNDKEENIIESLYEKEIEIMNLVLNNEKKGQKEIEKSNKPEDAVENYNKNKLEKTKKINTNENLEKENKEDSSLLDKSFSKDKKIKNSDSSSLTNKKENHLKITNNENNIINNNLMKKSPSVYSDSNKNELIENTKKHIQYSEDKQTNKPKDINKSFTNLNQLNNNNLNQNKIRELNRNKNKKIENSQNIIYTNIPSNPLKPKSKKPDPEMEKINKNWKSNLGDIEKQKEKEFFERFDSKENSDSEEESIQEYESKQSSEENIDVINSMLIEENEKEQEEIKRDNKQEKKNYNQFMKSPTLSSKSNKKINETKEILNSPKNDIRENSIIKKIKIEEKIEKKMEILEKEKRLIYNINEDIVKLNKIDELLEAKNNIKELLIKEKNKKHFNSEKNKDVVIEKEKNEIKIIQDYGIKDKIIPAPPAFQISKEIDVVQKIINKINNHKGDNLQRNFEIFCLRLAKSIEVKTFLYNDYINEYLNILINLSQRLKIGYSFIGSFYLNILRRDEFNIDAILGDSNNDTKKIDIMFFIKNEFKNFFTKLYPNKQSNVTVTNENNKTVKLNFFSSQNITF